ncbi:hypothetical protein ACIQB5_16050 [Streptomyces sp. NPDC088560]|uniref:hypothetical protein n=1 Tax=Streptomyces sp. NPDC088560 TaxID=3365868 RepID=UPI00381690D8
MPLSSGADETRSGPVVPCPVCLHPGGEERRCRVCGFPLLGDPVLGAATEEDHRCAADELAAAAHTWDLDAARRTLSDAAGRSELAGLLRPPPAGLSHPAAVPHPSGLPHPADGPGPRPASAPPVTAGPPALADLLRGLTTGEVPEALFVEFGTQQASVVRVFADTAGLPHTAAHAETSWTELVQELGTADALRRFRLAGGVGTVEPVDRLGFDRAVRGWLRAVVPPADEVTGTRSTAVVLLRGGTGWTLLDRAAAVLYEVCAVRAEGNPAAAPGPGTAAATTARVRDVLRGAPLREPHTLLLARAGHGAGDHVPVELAHHVLFEAGLRLAPGETRTASVTVHGGPPVMPPPSAGAGTAAGAVAAPSATLPVVLPLLAGRYRPQDRHPPLVRLPRVELPALGSAHLTFVLHGPGEIEVRTGGHVLAETAHGPEPDLHDLVHRMPRRLRRPRPLELLCAVEMSGTADSEVAERVGFTDDLIRAAQRHAGAGGGLRVAVIGYYDHAPRNAHQPARGLIRAVPPGPPGRALRQLRELPVEIRSRDTLTSSLEDALKAAARMTAGPRTDSLDRVLLVVGGRPPALPAQDGLVPGCPRAVDWREQLGTLRHRGVRVGIRAAPFTAPAAGVPSGHRLGHYLKRTWQDLTGTEGLVLRPGTDSAERAALALTAGQPHGTDGSPLAFAAPPLPPRPPDPPRS